MRTRLYTTVCLAALTTAACNAASVGGASTAATATAAADQTALAGWSEATHGKGAKPDYAAVFPRDQVKQFRITIAKRDWEAMLADMTKLQGARGTAGANGGMGMGGARPGGQGGQAGVRPARPAGMAGRTAPAAGAGATPSPSVSPGASPSPGASASPVAGAPGGAPGGNLGARPAGGMGGGGPLGSGENPMWAPGTITYDGRVWNHVGVRFKGNSSLSSAWRSGTDRIPFKLDFEEFEDEDPAVKDQRFYGFKQLSLSTNMGDATGMRDTVAYQLMADAGLPYAMTGFYEVVLDHGDGEASLGLYSAIEVIDDTAVEHVFGEDSGNIYEGDGQAVSLAAGTRDKLKDSYLKENNKDTDWSDVEGLYDALHATTRTTDAAAWRAGLEKVFDVDGFLKWLAIAAVIQHWDTYGGMAHNFYLYADPDQGGRLTWISWDHNLVLGAMGGGGAPPEGFVPPDGMASGAVPPEGFPFPDMAASGAAPVEGGRGGMGGGMGRNASLDKKEVTDSWPLIRFLMDDPVYYAAYVKYLKSTIEGPFEPTKMKAAYARYADVLRAVSSKKTAAGDGTGFDAAVQALSAATDARVQAVEDFLAGQAQ